MKELNNLERALVDRFGKDIIDPVRSDWSKEEELEFLDQIEEFESKRQKLIGKRKEVTLFNGEESCEHCGKIKAFFNIKDDVCKIKYDCCNTCYVKHIEGREDRWKSGWRPEAKNNGK